MKNKLHFDNNKLILFDCFGVVSTAVIIPWFIEHFGKEEGTRIDAEYCHRADRGEISLYEYAKSISDIYHFDVNELLEEWINEGNISQDFINFIYELRKNGYVVCLASNASNGLVEEVFKRNNVPSDLFDHLFISCYMKEAKPDRIFYEMILDSFDKKFDEVFMIDDRQVNLDVVPTLNIKPVLYKDLNQLKELFLS